MKLTRVKVSKLDKSEDRAFRKRRQLSSALTQLSVGETEIGANELYIGNNSS